MAPFEQVPGSLPAIDLDQLRSRPAPAGDDDTVVWRRVNRAPPSAGGHQLAAAGTAFPFSVEIVAPA